MFQIFYLEQPDVLPVGDLGVRKGIARYFGIRGSGKGAALCPKKDLGVMQQAIEPYQPYQSLITYYMWKAADTKDFYHKDANHKITVSTPAKKEKKGTIMRQVTP
jgi:3-methyladenine DNA glycosylase/8-oxoguanine DNA glycosylase